MRTLPVAIAVSLLFGVSVWAAGAEAPIALLLRVNGPVHVAANETSDTIVVINGNAFIDGTVNGTVVVVHGRAEISGNIRGDVIAFGDIFLDRTARVHDDVTIFGGALTRAAGAVIGGNLNLEQTPDVQAPSAPAIFFAAGVFVLGLALLLTLIAWRPLSNSAALLIAHPFNVLVIGVLLALSVTAAAIALLPTGIGVLLGLAVLICVIPAGIFSGFAVAAMAIGDWVALREPNLIPARPHTRALAEVTIGVIVAMIVVLIPIAGAVLLLIASMMGVGALVTRLWEAWPRRAVAPPAVL
jgi:hypothetical protein